MAKRTSKQTFFKLTESSLRTHKKINIYVFYTFGAICDFFTYQIHPGMYYTWLKI